VGIVGEDVELTAFSGKDRQQYRAKVRRCLDVFSRMLGEAKFEFDKPITGLEIELNLASFACCLARTDRSLAKYLSDSRSKAVHAMLLAQQGWLNWATGLQECRQRRERCSFL